MPAHRWILAATLLLPVLALAGRQDAARESVEEQMLDDRGPAASAAEIPALSKLLEKAQWEPTPELSGAFRAGHIFEQTELGHRPLATDCIEATPAENPYTAADVITSLQAGVQVGALVARAAVTGEVVKKIKFGTPIQSSVPRLDLVLTEACTAKLQRLPRSALERSYVIQEVLRAQISEQTCGRVDANGRIVGLGAADAELQRACSQASLEPVAVGYRHRHQRVQQHPGRSAHRHLRQLSQGVGIRRVPLTVIPSHPAPPSHTESPGQGAGACLPPTAPPPVPHR